MMNELQHYGVKGMKWGRRMKRFVPTQPKGRQPDWKPKKSERQKRWEDDHGINPHRPNGTTNSAINKKLAEMAKKTIRKMSNADVRELDKDLKRHTTGKRVVLEMLDERTGKKTGTVTALESKYTEAELRKLEREAIRKGNYRKIDVSNW